MSAALQLFGACSAAFFPWEVVAGASIHLTLSLALSTINGEGVDVDAPYCFSVRKIRKEKGWAVVLFTTFDLVRWRSPVSSVGRAWDLKSSGREFDSHCGQTFCLTVSRHGIWYRVFDHLLLSDMIICRFFDIIGFRIQHVPYFGFLLIGSILGCFLLYPGFILA